MGRRASGSTRYSGELAARAAGNSALEGDGSQYWPIRSSILAWRTLLQASLQGHKELDTTEVTLHAQTQDCFLPVTGSAPVRTEREEGAAAWLVGTLAAQSVQGHGLPLPQELWPYPSLFCQPLVSGDQTTSWASLCSSAHSGGAPLEGSLALGPSLLLGASGTQRPPPAPDWGPTL